MTKTLKDLIGENVHLENVKIKRSGSLLSIRLPREFIEKNDLDVGDEVVMAWTDKGVVIFPPFTKLPQT